MYPSERYLNKNENVLNETVWDGGERKFALKAINKFLVTQPEEFFSPTRMKLYFPLDVILVLLNLMSNNVYRFSQAVLKYLIFRNARIPFIVCPFIHMKREYEKKFQANRSPLFSYY